MSVYSFMQGKDKTMSVLRGLLQDLGSEPRDDTKVKQCKAAEVRMVRDAAGSPADDPPLAKRPPGGSTGIMKRCQSI